VLQRIGRPLHDGLVCAERTVALALARALNASVTAAKRILDRTKNCGLHRRLGREIKLALPSTLKLEGDQLKASGAVELSHGQLGLKPFRALLGSLRVAERMKFRYRIRASKVPKWDCLNRVNFSRQGIRWRAVGWPPITDELASAQ
jgi:hypothetical protein